MCCPIQTMLRNNTWTTGLGNQGQIEISDLGQISGGVIWCARILFIRTSHSCKISILYGGDKNRTNNWLILI